MKTLKFLIIFFIQLLIFISLLTFLTLILFKYSKPKPKPHISTTTEFSSQTTTTPTMFTKSTTKSYEMMVWIYSVDDNLIHQKLRVKETDTIRRIKEIIEEKQNISKNLMNLSLFGTKLEDDKTLLFYNIHEGTIIDLMTF